MFSTMFGREVPTLLRWDWEEEEINGPLINDIFLGSTTPPRSPLQVSCVAFVEAQQDITNDGYDSSNNFTNVRPIQHYTTPPNGLVQQQQPNTNFENKWLDEYVNFNEETFGSSSRSLPVNTGSNFPQHATNSFGGNTGYESNLFYSNSFAGFHNHQQQNSNKDQQMQDLSGPSISGTNISASQFSQLNLQEPSFGVETNGQPPIPESEYSASYSRPGSAYSTDWSNSGSDHSSSQSQDEIFDEILRECAEIERKSVSPPIRHRAHAKRRSGTVVKRSSTEQVASNSSSNSLTAFGNSDRKKELNRIAATKYREKKRKEREVLGSEHKDLETRNHELRATAKELKTEVSYLKKLLKDMERRAS